MGVDVAKLSILWMAQYLYLGYGGGEQIKPKLLLIKKENAGNVSLRNQRLCGGPGVEPESSL